ncbi:MAG: hypothetical protein D6725_17605, partial [Planctomycetota bacterium]
MIRRCFGRFRKGLPIDSDNVHGARRMTNGGTTWYLVQLEFKRVQTYLFSVPELKGMIGANTLLGEVLRGRLLQRNGNTGFASIAREHSPQNLQVATALPASQSPNADNLPALAVQCGASLPPGIDIASLEPAARLGSLCDPLSGADRDDPNGNYANGVLARDGGHLNAAFPDQQSARRFVQAARQLIARRLPGLLVDWRVFELKKENDHWVLPKDERGRPTPVELSADQYTHCGGTPVYLPQYQICDITGLLPAAEEGCTPDGVREWFSSSVREKRKAATRFAQGKSYDVLGILRNP